MKTKHFSKMLGSSSKMGMMVRLGLAAFAIIGSLTLAISIFTAHSQKANAATPVIPTVPTTRQPWGVALDGAGHIWVAEPNCDPSPACVAPPSTGGIGEYSTSNLAKVADFAPTGTTVYTPNFVAIDGAGTIWFTDSSHAAIGSLVPSTNAWTEYPITIAGGLPYDLVFDNAGKLWFTDYNNGAIGLFDTVKHTYAETPVPNQAAAKTILYGITKAPNGTIWVAENNTSFIDSFTPPASGNPTITQHAVLTNSQHLITVDKNENVWFSTGFNGQIGELPAGSTTAQTFCVSTTVTSPHISGIGVDSSGKVWFDDSVNSRVGYLDPATYANDCTAGTSAGVTYTTFTSGSHTHDGLLVDNSNNVWFTELFGSTLGEIPAGTVLPPSGSAYPPGPTSKTWYFAEGRVGAGFVEYLTLGNPDPVNDCSVNIQYLLETGAPVTKAITVPHASRVTEPVNADLNTPVTTATGVSVATLITTVASSPCAGGVVAERPMYFNYHGNTSNSDVVGATHLATNFYFADVPSGGAYHSFLTILNPPGGQPATVTANYYANGALVGTQNTIVPAGQRGTLAPGALTTLPLHSSAVVTSTQPVVIERPTYFSGLTAGVAGMVTGASSVVGSQALQKEWFFAEGYAGTSNSGGSTQEDLVISNVDPANKPASVTINLEYLNGTKHPFVITVNPNSQVIWDVNANGTAPASNEVSADVVATGALVVVSRQMYFHYAHNLNGTTLQVVGGTEVTGQTGTFSSYSFAEGYSNRGYNEWLTLQNPTATTETIYVIMINGYGRTYSQQFMVGPNTRFTQDISALVLSHLVQVGDDHRGYEVSMTVETIGGGGMFVAERPMYSNTAGSAFPTQGGNDAFGYTGF